MELELGQPSFLSYLIENVIAEEATSTVLESMILVAEQDLSRLVAALPHVVQKPRASNTLAVLLWMECSLNSRLFMAGRSC
jgi:hypothetical protein